MRKELYTALKNDVTEVQGRVYPLIMPQDTEKNAVVYRIIATNDTTGITCSVPINTRFGVQIDVFAHTYQQSVEIMAKVREVLRDHFLVFNSFTYEDYQNITLKYRQILDVQLELKPVHVTPPQAIIVNHGVPVVNHGLQVIP